MTIIQGVTGNMAEISPDGRLKTDGKITGTTESINLVQSATQNGNGNEVVVSGNSSIVFRVEGTFVAKINFECIFSEGASWRPLRVVDISTGETSSIQPTGITSSGYFRADVTGLYKVRARVSNHKSGTVTIVSRLTALPTNDGARVQVSGAAIPSSHALPVYDRHAKRAFPSGYAKPYLQKKDFRVRGFDKATGEIYGVKTLSGTSTQLIGSKDNLQTIQEGFTFTTGIIQKVVTSDTHILVSVWTENMADGGKLYRTLKTNGVTGPFEEVQEIQMGAGIRVDRLGFNSFYDYPDSKGRAIRNYVMVTEYGTKVKDKNARRGFLSKDGGATFTQIFEGINADEAHIHTMVYDKYMDRFWLSHGDAGGATIFFSDDHGTTWQTAVVGYWPTVIIPTPHYVIFGADNKPMGLHRWNRRREEYERSIDSGVISRAFEPDFFPVRGQHDGSANFATEPVYVDDWTIYIPFTGAGNVSKTFMLATGDGGETAHIVWMDRIEAPYFGFVTGVFGPTADDTIVAHYSDGREPTGDKVWRMPLLEWDKV